MAIACVYCGGAHPTAGEVRQCWERSQHDGHTAWRGARPSTGDPRPVPKAGVTAAVLTGAAYRLGRGPHVLGRNVVVAGGCEPPSDWDGCERIRIDTDAVREPLPTVERLRAAAFERRGVVIELSDDTAPAAGRAPTGPRVGCAIRIRRRRAAPPRLVELRRRARSRRAEVGARRSGRGARCRIRRRGRCRAPRRHGRVARRRAGPLHRSGRGPPGASRRRRRARFPRAARVQHVGRRLSPPTNSQPSFTPVARPASSPPPDPARRVCSPSGPVTCSSAGGCRRAP